MANIENNLYFCDICDGDILRKDATVIHSNSYHMDRFIHDECYDNMKTAAQFYINAWERRY